MSCTINLYLDKTISRKKVSDENQQSKMLSKATQKSNLKKELQIFLYLRHSGKTIKISVERKCTIEQWDSGKQRVNPRYYKSGSVALNEYFANVFNETAKIFEENNNKGIETTKNHLKAIIAKLNNRETSVQLSITFEDAFEEFIRNSAITKQENTIKKYRNAFNHLKNFSKSRGITLSFKKIDLEFQDCLREYFISDLRFAHNTEAKNFKTLKTFMNYSADRGHHQNMIYKKFESSEEETEIYALTIEELMKIYSHEFEEERLEKVKDVFCFACFSGLRFSDVINLKRENIFGNQLRITIKKTQESTTIPLNEYSSAILDKYAANENPLPVISSQKTNLYLKEIGRLLDINEPVRIIKHIGKEIEQKVVPKYDVLTFHVGRKTFISSCLVLGMHERFVKDFSGHKKDESFRRYVKFAENVRDKMMNDIWNNKNIEKVTL